MPNWPTLGANIWHKIENSIVCSKHVFYFHSAAPDVMGYDLTRFEGEVDEELICPICSGVLEEPLQVSCLLLSFVISYMNKEF